MRDETPMRARLASLTRSLERECHQNAAAKADHAVLHSEFDALKARYRALMQDYNARDRLRTKAVEDVIAHEKAKVEAYKATLLPANPDELKRLTDENADLQRKLAAAERSSLLHSDSQRQAMAKVRDLERDLSNARADSHALGSVANFAERISIMACMCALTSASAQAPECLTCEARRILGKNALRPSGTPPAPLKPTD